MLKKNYVHGQEGEIWLAQQKVSNFEVMTFCQSTILMFNKWETVENICGKVGFELSCDCFDGATIYKQVEMHLKAAKMAIKWTH